MSHAASATVQCRTWTRDGFLISTDPSLVPIAALAKAFASEEMYWAKPLPEAAMREMIDNSLCFGLYSPTPLPPRTKAKDFSSPVVDPAETLHEIATSVRNQQPSPSPPTDGMPSTPSEGTSSLIGFARAVTDRVTLLYLTDVFIFPEWQGQGLGKWLISCVQELVEDSMPHLRRTLCLVGGHAREIGVQFYGELMKMEPLADPALVLSWKGPGCTF